MNDTYKVPVEETMSNVKADFTGEMQNCRPTISQVKLEDNPSHMQFEPRF